ncbi:GyrI-like domain-containing protein [Aquibium microcysteis]|uniref:GyrI-like domain-containing protein n=1 Tax=Aquibium microcysteis TaxID=675281 RepID=UPI00165D2ED5|nr:GyrI-like domain-containing protein [Aquibium microcysteis]
MCQLCDENVRTRSDFAVIERPAETLVGLDWEGRYGEAAAGAVRATLRSLQTRVGKGDLWSGPLVGLSFNDRPDGFRYFVGAAAGEVGDAEGLVRIDLPARRHVASWHGEADGDVVAHYGRMIGWLASQGLKRAETGPHHREEYPRDGDFDGPPILRLMLPLA